MLRRRINECKKQFPDCPEEISTSCKPCPFYKDALKKQGKVEEPKNQAQPLNINV